MSSGPGAGGGADACGVTRLPRPGVLGSASRRLLWGPLGGDARRGRAWNSWRGRGPGPGVLLTRRSGLGAWRGDVRAGVRCGLKGLRLLSRGRGRALAASRQAAGRSGRDRPRSAPAPWRLGRSPPAEEQASVPSWRRGPEAQAPTPGPVKVALAPSPVPRQGQVLGRQAPRSPCAPGPAGEKGSAPQPEPGDWRATRRSRFSWGRIRALARPGAVE